MFPSQTASTPRLLCSLAGWLSQAPPESLAFPLPPLLKRCPDLEPDSMRASGCKRQPALACPLPQKPSYEWHVDAHPCWEEGTQGGPRWQMAESGMLFSGPSTLVTGAICSCWLLFLAWLSVGLKRQHLQSLRNAGYFQQRDPAQGLCTVSFYL